MLVEDQLTKKAEVFLLLLIIWVLFIVLFVAVDGPSKVVEPTERHWEDRTGFQECGLKTIIRYQKRKVYSHLEEGLAVFPFRLCILP